MSTKRIISKLDQINNFHFSQNCISLQFFEREKVYSKFVEVLEDVLHRSNVRTLRLPFRKILSSDRRMVRFLNIFEGLRKPRRKHWFSRLLEFSFYQQKMFGDLRRFFFKVNKQEMIKGIQSLKFYFFCKKTVAQKFELLRKVLVKNQREHLLHFFAECRQMPAYEIPLEKSPKFPFTRLDESGVTDMSTDRHKPQNIFNLDETSDSKHFSYNRLENLDTFQGFCSKDENVIKNSNFNTFYQPDKELQAQEFQLNSYGTFNKISDNWVRQGSPCESIKNNLVEQKLVPIQDLGEELEDQSESDRVIGFSPTDSSNLIKASSKVENKLVVLNSAKLSQVSGKSDQASLSVEKKQTERNTYTVHIDELMIGRKKRNRFKFNADSESLDREKTSANPKIHPHTNDFGSGDLGSAEFNSPSVEPKLESTRKITAQTQPKKPPNRDVAVLNILNSSTQTRKTRQVGPIARMKRPLDLIQKSRSQTRFKPERRVNKFQQKKFSESILKLAHSRSVSKKKTRKSSPSTFQSKTGKQLQSRFIRRFGRNRSGNKSRSRSRVKEVVEDLFRRQRDSRTRNEVSVDMSEPREKSVDRVSWNVPRSVILKSDVSVINLRVQANFKNQMKIALEKISVKLVNVGRCKRKRKQTLDNFSTVLDLYERYLVTLKKGGRDSPNLNGLIDTIRRIGGPIKNGISQGSFEKDLETLNLKSMQKIIEFLKAILEKDLLNLSVPFDSGSQNTNNFGTISSNLASNKYNSQVENSVGVRRFGEKSNLPVYSSEIFKRNVSAFQFNLSSKKIQTRKKKTFQKNQSVDAELRNFCVVLKYKIDFKIKKQLRMAIARMKNLPRKFKGRAWKNLPRIFVFLMKRRMLVSIKLFKVLRLQKKMKETNNKKKNYRKRHK